MAFADKMALQVQPSPRIFSEQILKRFAAPLDCLTAHLMLECAEADANYPFFCRSIDNDYQYRNTIDS